jgi:DNA-binding PadR family transcriptional regulator
MFLKTNLINSKIKKSLTTFISFNNILLNDILLNDINEVIDLSRGKSLDDEILTDSTYYILLALVKPIHGYGIMQKVQEISKGEMIIGPASLYSILKKLQDSDYIELLEDNEERRKTYTLTTKGKEIFKKDINRRISMVEQGKKVLQFLE